MKRLSGPMMAALLFLSACNQVESFEGEVDMSGESLRVGCAEALDLAESVGVACAVQLSANAVLVDETGENVTVEDLEGKKVRVVLDDPERMWNSTVGTRVTARKIVLLND